MSAATPPVPPTPPTAPAAPAPAAPTAPPAAPAPVAKAPPPAVPPAPAGQPPAGDPAWLPDRIAQAQRSALRDAGFESPAAAKAAATRLKELEDGQKTEQERLEAKVAALEGPAAKTGELQTVVDGYALTAMAGLTPEQQAAVKVVAGDDAGKQLKTIDALRPTWAAAPPPAGQPVPNAPAPVVPATTVQTQPTPAGTAAPGEDHLTKYEETYKRNPVEAAIYQEQHLPEIVHARAARRSKP